MVGHFRNRPTWTGPESERAESDLMAGLVDATFETRVVNEGPGPAAFLTCGAARGFQLKYVFIPF